MKLKLFSILLISPIMLISDGWAAGVLPGVNTPLGCTSSGDAYLYNGTTMACSTTLPSAATSQIYGGSGTAGAAQAVTLGTNLNIISGTLNATTASLPSATTSQLYGGSGSAGSAQAVTLGTNLSITGGTINAATGSAATLPSATTSQLYGGTGTAGTAQAITLGTNLSITGTTLNATGGTGSSLITFNPQTSSYTLVLSDAGKIVQMNVATANAMTVPPNSSVNFPVGTTIGFEEAGAGTTTIMAGSGVTLNYPSTLLTRVQYSQGSIVETATNVWLVSGDMQ